MEVTQPRDYSSQPLVFASTTIAGTGLFAAAPPARAAAPAACSTAHQELLRSPPRPSLPRDRSKRNDGKMPSLLFTHPKNYGPGSRTCRKCGNVHGLIRKYHMMLCRRCFRENAGEIGFHKVSLEFWLQRCGLRALLASLNARSCACADLHQSPHLSSYFACLSPPRSCSTDELGHPSSSLFS